MRRRSLSSPRPAALAAVLALAATAACRELAFEPQDPTTVTFAPALGVNLAQFTRLPSGTYYRDLAVGSGAVVESTSTVGTTFRGYLADGTVFDSTPSNVSATYTLTDTRVRRGFRQGLQGARQGSRRQIVVPPGEGYGNRTTPDNKIPAGSVLLFDVNITSVVTPVDTTKKTAAARAPR